MATGVGIDPARIAQLTEREETHLNAETSGSARMYERSRKVMPGGVPSSYQVRAPHPIFLERGSGSKVWDVDGSEYRDFHNGFGSMVQGHAHPAIVARRDRAHAARHALRRRDRGQRRRGRGARGGAGACPSGASRTRAPSRRWTRSGSRARHTGRELVVKMEGSYHGHHDTVMVSIGIDIDDDAVGPADRPNSVPVRRRHPRLHRRADDPGAVQQRRRARRPPGRALRPGRLRDHGAGHDEHRRRAAAGRLPGGGARDHEEAQRPADLRRGQDGHHDRRRRRGRALRRHARHRHARQGAGRRAAQRRDRRQRGGHGLHRGRHGLPGRHVQRQSAQHGGRARELPGGHDARRRTPTSSTSTTACTTASARSSRSTASRRT